MKAVVFRTLEEVEKWRKPFLVVAGIDEAGRGPLAGSVFAAAVILKGSIEGLNDSKKLSEKKRWALEPIIKSETVWAVGEASVEEIEEHNILRATLLAMKRAWNGLGKAAEVAAVDGIYIPEGITGVAVIKGDALVQEISAASILAKCARDRHILALAEEWPQYGWVKNKGYGTADHMAALKQHGHCRWHRTSFHGVVQ